MVRILAIDDERNVLLSLRDRVKFSKQAIEFICFGIDVNVLSKNQEDFESEVSESFIKFVQDGHAIDYDVILLDFSMPKRNARSILEELQNDKLPPVIVMSADNNAIHNHIIGLLQKNYAKRYIYKSSSLFEDELYIYALNVTEEYYNHQMIELLDTLNKEDFSSFDIFAQKLADTFMKQLPDTYVVVRKYDIRTKHLLKANELEGVELSEVIDKTYDKRLFDVLSSENGYKIDNNFNFKDYPKLQKKFGDSAKSLIIRIGKKQSPQGIINIIKKSTDFSLQDFTVKSIKSSIDSLNVNIVNIEQASNFNKVLRFLSDIMSEENENEILKKYTKIIHEIFNKNHSENKTTLKTLTPGTDILELLCKGDCQVDRDAFEPKIMDKSISSTVFRENISILTYDTRKMDEVWARFKEVYKKINGFDIDESEKIEFYETAKSIEMRSGLCVPISSFSRDDRGGVFGVINLESSIPSYYNIREMKYLFNMSQVVGGRIESIRNQKLLNGLLESSVTIDYKDKLNGIRKVLKDYLGFFSLSIFTDNDNKLKLEDIVLDDDNINIAEIKEKYSAILKDSEEFRGTVLDKVEKYFREGNSFFYLPEIYNAPIHMVGRFQDEKLTIQKKDNKEIELSVSEQGFYKVESYYAQAIRHKQELIGILVLEFKVSNPMLNHNLEIIEKVTELLGVIYLSKDDRAKDEIRDLYIQEYVRSFQSNFKHIVYNYYKDVEHLLDREKTPEILQAFREILNISRHYDGILESDSYKEIINILVDEFLDRRTNNIVVKIQLDDFKVFDSRKEFLYILFFHLFSNAKAILENVDKPLVTIKSYIKNGFLYIKVHDNGKLPNHPERIFEEAYSERHDKGGFGLFHLKNRIEDKGGEITFLTKPKKHFRVTIPLNKIGEQNEE